ncbi:MAG: TetR/AcrR family transcriptional regulator [Lachnospiraceae bacterium]|nr:TetR/AcrR family transcriptional regulator [Lachnospiraceae bacterium]
MYQGTNKTAIASQKQVAGALMKLMQEKHFNDISISELCKLAGVSRQTFYILFQTKENVIIYMMHDQYAYSANDYCDGKLTLQKFCDGYAEYIITNKQFLKTLVENNVEYLLYDSLYAALTCESCQNTMCTKHRTYAAHYLSGAIVSTIKAYVEDGCKQPLPQLKEIISTLFGGKLFTE